MGKTNPKGRSKTEPFVFLPHNLLKSAAWQTLSSDAKVIFIELKRRYNGRNNAEISLSCREAGAIFNGSKTTASRVLKELQQHGFIKQSCKGYFTGRLATTWMLTTESSETAPPTHEWKKWSPENQFKVPETKL